MFFRFESAQPTSNLRFHCCDALFVKPSLRLQAAPAHDDRQIAVESPARDANEMALVGGRELHPEESVPHVVWIPFTTWSTGRV